MALSQKTGSANVTVVMVAASGDNITTACLWLLQIGAAKVKAIALRAHINVTTVTSSPCRLPHDTYSIEINQKPAGSVGK